jgi:arginine decarboxylase
VSSIFPRQAISKKDESLLKPGQILYVVMSENATNELHRLVASSVGVAAEGSVLSIPSSIAVSQTDKLARIMLRIWLPDAGDGAGVDFDLSRAKMSARTSGLSNKIAATRNVTQSAIGDRRL